MNMLYILFFYTCICINVYCTYTHTHLGGALSIEDTCIIIMKFHNWNLYIISQIEDVHTQADSITHFHTACNTSLMEILTC